MNDLRKHIDRLNREREELRRRRELALNIIRDLRARLKEKENARTTISK